MAAVFSRVFFTSSERQDQRLFSRQTPCPRPATTASFNTHSPAGEQSTHSRDIFFTLKVDVVLNEFLASKNGWGGSVFFFFFLPLTQCEVRCGGHENVYHGPANSCRREQAVSYRSLKTQSLLKVYTFSELLQLVTMLLRN